MIHNFLPTLLIDDFPIEAKSGKPLPAALQEPASVIQRRSLIPHVNRPVRQTVHAMDSKGTLTLVEHSEDKQVAGLDTVVVFPQVGVTSVTITLSGSEYNSDYTGACWSAVAESLEAEEDQPEYTNIWTASDASSTPVEKETVADINISSFPDFLQLERMLVGLRDQAKLSGSLQAPVAHTTSVVVKVNGNCELAVLYTRDYGPCNYASYNLTVRGQCFKYLWRGKSYEWVRSDEASIGSALAGNPIVIHALSTSLPPGSLTPTTPTETKGAA